MFKLLLTISFCLVCSVVAQNGNVCNAINGKKGICKKLSQCNYIKQMYYDKTTNQQMKQIMIRKSFCDWSEEELLVCCDQDLEENFNTKMMSNPLDVSNHKNLKLLPKSCGITQRYRVSGNFEAAFPHDSPWSAMLVYTRNKILCGGSVINKRYILTAAHCIAEPLRNSQLVSVIVGAYNLLVHNNTQSFQIESKHVHPKYSNKGRQNDIALIRLSDDINFKTSKVRAVCLPLQDYVTVPFDKKATTLFGWRISDTTFLMYYNLQSMIVDLLENNVCAEKYKDMKIRHTQMCTVPRSKNEFCVGDNGGPLEFSIFKERPRFVQYGINSMESNECSPNGKPTIYTRVDYYLDWILNTIKD